MENSARIARGVQQTHKYDAMVSAARGKLRRWEMNKQAPLHLRNECERIAERKLWRPRLWLAYRWHCEVGVRFRSAQRI